MKIIKDCPNEDTYGEVKFTLSKEDITKIVNGISNSIYSSISKNDTMLLEDGKLLLWLLTTPKDFESEIITYSKPTLERVKHWLNN